jgi:hypothetical protein
MTQKIPQAGGCGACNSNPVPPQTDFEYKKRINIVSIQANVVKKKNDTIYLDLMVKKRITRITDGYVSTATVTDSSVKKKIKEIAIEYSPNIGSANTDGSLLLPNGTEKIFTVNSLKQVTLNGKSVLKINYSNDNLRANSSDAKKVIDLSELSGHNSCRLYMIKWNFF